MPSRLISIFRVTPIGVDGEDFPVRLIGRDAAASAVATARSVDDGVEVVSLIRFNKAKFAKDHEIGRISELHADSSAGGSEEGPEDTSSTSAETHSPSNTIRRSRSRTRRATGATDGGVPVRLEDPTGDPQQIYRRNRFCHDNIKILFSWSQIAEYLSN